MAYQYPQSDFAKKHYQDGRLEGQAEGRQEGRQEGRTEESNSMLVTVLQAKFGILSDEVLARLKAGSTEDRHRWATRVLTADTLEAVFEDA